MAGNGLSLEKEQLDPERLKRITEGFTRLQGLYAVPFGVVFGLSSVAATIWKDRDWGVLFMAFGQTAALIVSAIWIRRYYARRFGVLRHESIQPPKPWKNWNKNQMIVVSVTLLTLFIGIMQVEHVTHPPVDLFSFVFLLLVPWYLLTFPGIDLRSTRGVVLVTATAVALAVVDLLPLWVSFPEQQLMFWKLLRAGSMGICVVAVGLSDHFSLTQLLRPEKQEDTHA